MKVIVAGASGFLGSALTRRLSAQGHEVQRLVRRTASRPDEIEWHPDQGQLASTSLEGADCVVCLSGAGIGNRRWTEKYKVELRSSRIDTVGLLARTIAALPAQSRPGSFLSGSAMGIYGDRGDEVLSESASLGTGFLCDLAKDWEAAATPAADAGVRVVHLRTSHVLKAGEGLLKPLVPLFKLGGGGKLASGSQYMSWIALDDYVRALQFLAEKEVHGPVNLSSPNPVTNAEFTKALAKAVHRPAVMPVPKFALKVALGELADEGALTSQRLTPGVLTANGFSFDHPDLASAMEWALAK